MREMRRVNRHFIVALLLALCTPAAVALAAQSLPSSNENDVPGSNNPPFDSGDVNPRDSARPTVQALILAAQRNQPQEIDSILAAGVDPDSKDETGLTALIEAAAAGHEEALMALLARGADPNSASSTGRTALMAAAENGHSDIVGVLRDGIPQFAISIGLQREGTMIAGVIYNPANDELYTAERGKGAFLNDQRLRVAGRRKLSDCVIACGLPHIGRGDHELSRLEMTEIQNRVAGLRRFGAASLDMAFVAAGRLDGYWERNLQAWDMAAGQIMVREAGGIVSGIEGDDDPLKTGNVICGNEFIHAELVKILKPLGK